MNRLAAIALFLVFFLLIDWYVFQAVKTVSGGRKWIEWTYWIINGVSLLSFVVYWTASPNLIPTPVRSLLAGFFFVNYASKLVAVVFVLLDDVWRAAKWAVHQLYNGNTKTPEQPNLDSPAESPKISRSEFLMQTALVAGAVPAIGLTWGILSGAHDYRVRKVSVRLPNLPKAFDGIRIAQLSDIHSGSFFNKKAVIGGVEMLLNEKPDVIFFTGDLVNNVTSEVKEYVSVFEKLKAPLGVFSTLGNHDYGDYTSWESLKAKQANLTDMLKVHRQMGWNLLMNEHRMLETNGEKIAVLGVENYGKGRFPKYGKLDLAHKNTQAAPVKLLLSHDPSHWDLQILPDYQDIDLTFSGHTHGMQFGVEAGSFRWSPAKWVYEQWADLYEKNGRYLYVNRGFGYLGFPGRVGILPEITILELKS